MVGVFTMQQVDMQGGTGVEAEGPQEFLGQTAVEGSELLVRYRHAIMKIGPVGEIYHNPYQGLIHRHMTAPVAPDAALVMERPGKRLAKADADILDRVMIVDLGVAIGLEFQIEESMDSKQGQHMVQEWHTGVYGVLTLAIEGDGELYIGLCRLSLNRRHPWGSTALLYHDVLRNKALLKYQP